MDCRHTECARAFMAWFQIMTWKKPGMLRAVPSMLRAVPDDALVDDAVTAAGLRTWKKLWMLRTAPDDGLIQSAVMAADVVHRAATRYEQATLAYLASYTGRHSMIQFEQLARAELHWMAVCFLQYVRRHHAWIEEVFKIMNLDLGQTFDEPDDERTSFRHSMRPVKIEERLCVDWDCWYARRLVFFYDDVDRIAQAHRCAHALVFAMLGLKRVGSHSGSQWGDLDKDTLSLILQALMKKSKKTMWHPHGTCLPPKASTVTYDRALVLRRRSAPPAEWALGPKEVRYIHDAAAQMSEHSSEDEADSMSEHSSEDEADSDE